MKTASPWREGSGGKDVRKRLGKWAEVMKEEIGGKWKDREEERECVDIG